MREFAISIYLTLFKGLFGFFKLFPLKKKITLVVSFPENAHSLYETLQKKQSGIQLVVLSNKRSFDAFKGVNELTYLIESKHILHTIVGIYHLATSKRVVVDNYYGFLAVTKFKETVKCIQMWHAVGAIKKFGAEDPANANRSDVANQRFHRVYKRFDRIVIGSDFMGDIFKQAFVVSEDIFLRTGIPRTDLFFDESKCSEIQKALYQKQPLLKDKKVILYAPTFRRTSSVQQIKLDVTQLYDALKKEYVVLVKRHPLDNSKLHILPEHEDFIFDYTNHSDVNELLLITDVLITDYSSIPMEFSLLKRQMIFFAYDLEEYKKSNGFWEDYKQSVPGPVAKNTDEIVDAILNQPLDIERIEAYAQKWTKYCDGNASNRLADEILKPWQN